MSRYELIHADCRHVMANMGDDSVDAVVCDPPYHLTSIVKRFGPGCAPQQYGTDGAYARAARGFMGQTWDGGNIAFDPAMWAEVLRVLKPGGHLFAFSGTRTYHRMAVAIEDSGFEIRDMFSWLYGSGFPKSHDFAAASKKGGVRVLRPEFEGHPQADGWGTSVKPAQEPICMARKPLAGTVAANVLAYGTGALNIDGCRIEATDGSNRARPNSGGKGGGGVYGESTTYDSTHNQAGRFPANVLHDGSAAVEAIFPAEAGANAPVHTRRADKFRNTYNSFAGSIDERGSAFQGDAGSAARFFGAFEPDGDDLWTELEAAEVLVKYCAKASNRDRDEGCEHLPTQRSGGMSATLDGTMLTGSGNERTTERANHHPTVKPTELMRHLVRLITPPGGIVFDPFAGSGSTGKSALLEGFRFIGAEMTPEYIPIARARLEWAVNQRG